MASKYRSTPEQEVQDYLSQVREGKAGQNPADQTLARSTGNPLAQRQGMRAMADRTSDNLANIEDAQREQEQASKQAERDAVKAAKEQDRAAEAARARDVRAAAAAGAKTVTDIETGKRSIATHPDGAPVFESGPISPVKPLGEVGQTLQDSQTGEKRDVPNMGIMLGGDSGALGATGTERQQVLGQQVRDDRGNVSVIPPKTETDPKTGQITYDQKNETTGRMEKLPAGIDWQAREIAARKAQNAQDEQAAALEHNAAAQARAAFEPQWQPVKAEYLKAKSELEGLPSPLVRRGSAWVHIDERTGKDTMATPAEVEYQKKRREEAQARYDRAAAAHDPLAAQNEQITLAERSAKEKRLKVAEDRIRIEAGLPDDATETLTRTLAAQEAPDVTAPETEAAREVIGTPEPSANPAAPAPEKPLIPTDDPIRTKNFAAAFEGLRDPGQFTVGMTDKGYKMIQRNGANIGMIEDSGGAPVVVLNNGANADLKSIASLGGTKGVPVYLTDGGKRQPIAKEAAWATQAFQTANQAMALPFGFNDMLQTPGTASPLADITGQLKDMGADYQSIVAKVKNGDISMQIGESLVKGIYGDTLKASDPLKPEAFTAFLDENPDQKSAWQAAANDKPAQSAVVTGFVSDWYAKNQHKPGVTWAMQEAARQALAPGSGGAWQKTKDVGGFLLDAGGSMIGLLAAYPTLTGMGIYSGLSGDEAVDTANKELWEQRLRADKNFIRGLVTNSKKWTTPEGKKATSDLQSALMELRAANTTRDVYPGGVTDPRWKADVKAKIESVTDAAHAFHSLNQENGWVMTRDDVDPNKNKVLKASLGAYLETGDPDAWQQFQRRLLLDKGSLQSEQYNKDLTAGSGRFASAVIGGAVASDFEAVVEILSDVVTVGASKAITLGGKALKAESVASKFASASRIARFGEQAAKEFHNLGMVADTLANPANKLGKASNFMVKGAKAGAVNALSEGVEEGISALGDPTTTFASGMEQAAGGALMGLVLAPIMVVPSMAATMSRENYKSEQRVKSLVEAYNKAGAKDPDFKPITRDQAIAAIQLADNPARKVASDKLEAAKIELELANNELAGTQAGLKNIQAQGKDAAVAVPGDQKADTTSRAEALQRWQADNASQEQAAQGRVESAASRYSRALGAYAEASGELTNIMGTALEVSQSTQGMSAADRAQVVGLAKVGFGRADLLTGSERSAIAGRKTRDGLPYFETTKDGSEILTDAGRAEVQEQFPVLGRHLATPESTALFNAAKAAQPQPTAPNGQDVQGQPGSQAAPQTAQPAPANPIASGGSVQPAAGPSGNAGGTGAPTPEAVSGNAAAMDAAEYSALRAQDPTLPDIPAVVAAARSAGQPVSPSMEKAAGTPQPDGQTVSGSGQTVSAASKVAEQVKASVEKAIPGVKGRISIVPQSLETGGADIVIESGEIRLSVADIEKAIQRAGGDEAKAKANIENIVARHEVVHVVQVKALRPMWEAAGKPGTFEAFFLDYYGKLAPDLLSKQAVKAASEIYGKDAWDRIPSEAQKAAEFVRMLVEAKLDPEKSDQFSELFRAVNNRGAKSALAQMIKAAVDLLRKMKLTGAAAEHVAKVEELYRELTAESKSVPSAEKKEVQSSDPISGLRIDTSGNTARVLNGNEVLWQGPADKAQAELESLQAAQSSPMRITGEAIKAALVKFPRLSGKLRAELENAADEIIDELDAMPAGERMAAAERAISDRIDRIADREAERTGKNRMEIIEGFRAVAGKRSSQQAASIEQAVIGNKSAADFKHWGKQETRPTPNGEMSVDVTSTFVDLDQLVGSSDPLFPGGALQPRNRSTQASQNQREEMVQNLRDKADQHRRYLEGVTTDSGRMVIAPLFGADGKQMTNEAGKPLFYVISGNGRRNALSEAASRKVAGPVTAGFREAAASENIDVEGMAMPVPVSIFVPESAKQAIDLAEFSNRDAQLSVSNTEQANRDAASIEKANILKLWEPDSTGDPAAASNRDFVKSFARAVGDEGILDNRGELTDEGAKRIERAMVAMLLGPDQGPVLDSLFNRAGALGLRAILGGVASETGSLLKLAASKPDFDLSPVLANALRTAVEAKQAVASGQFRDVSEFFDQGSLFESTAATPERQLARAIVESRSRKAVREILAAYRTGADAVDTGTMSMFAEAETTREDLILKALEARPIEQVIAEVEAEFGKDADLPAKLRIGAAAIKKLDAGQRREFAAAIGAEVERLRDGVISAEEWQRLNPDALGSKEALFQRFLDSHDANTIQGGFNRLLSKPVQSVLASSPDSANPGKYRRRFDAVLGHYAGIVKDMKEKSESEGEVFQRLAGSFGPNAVTQAIKDFATLTKLHEPYQSGFDDEIRALAEKHHGKPMLAPMKGRKRSVEKIVDEYDGVASMMKDIIRASIVASDINDVDAIAADIHDRYTVVKFKNRFSPPIPSGYSDMLFTVELASGVFAEIQVLIPEMLEAKKIGHILYERQRSIRKDPKRKAEVKELDAQMLELYTAAGLAAIEASTTASNSAAEISASNANFRAVLSDNARLLPNRQFNSEPSGSTATGMPSTSKNLVPAGKSEAFITPADSKQAGSNQVISITTDNISEYAGNVDVMDLAKQKGNIAGAFEMTKGARIVALSTLVSHKNELEDPKFKAGLKKDPRQNAADWILKAIHKDPAAKRRAPLDVIDNGNGTYEITDGNATAQALMLAGWERVPVIVHPRASLKSSPGPMLDLFGGIEEQITGPRAKVKRNALAAVKAQEPGSKAQTNIAKQIAKREGLADLDLFAGAAVKSLAKKPKKSESAPDELDLFSGIGGSGSRGAFGSATSQSGGSGTVRGMAGTGDLFDLAAGNAASGQSGIRGSGNSRGGLGGEGLGTAGNADTGATGSGGGTSLRGDRKQRQNGDSGTDAGRVELDAEGLPPEVPVPANEADRNARIDAAETLVPKGQGAKIDANFKVIELLRQLTEEGRNATEAEKAQLLTYSGWGHSKGAFDDAKAAAYAGVSGGWYDKEWARDKAAFKRNNSARFVDRATGELKPSIYDLYAWNEKWGETHRELKERLSDAEYDAAKRSVLNAHYTTPAIIDAQWKMLEKLGFKGGRALEPGAGIGHYIGTQPAHLAARTVWSAVELDKVTSQILALLYPQVRVNSVSPGVGREVTGQGFEEALIPNNSQDIVISNVPFHETGPWQSKKEFKRELNLHNYFFARALDKVKPGGLICFITSSSTMENNARQRAFLASKGDLIAAVRLPNNAFKENAGTEVTTDIIILRKPDGRKVQGHAWQQTRVVGRDTVNLKRGDQTPIQYLKGFDVEGRWTHPELEAARAKWDAARVAELQIADGKEFTEARKTAAAATKTAWTEYVAAFEKAEGESIGLKLEAELPIRVNEYFAANPSHAFGQHSLAGSMYKADEYALIPEENGPSLEERFAAVIDSLPSDIMGRENVVQLATAKDMERGDKPFSFVERDGKFWQVGKDRLDPVEWSPGEITVFRSWSRVKDAVRNLITAELDPLAEADEIKDLRETLNREYGKHVGQFGPISKTGRGARHDHLLEDPDFPLTSALETEERYTDKKGKPAVRYLKADIFRTRMNKPLIPPAKAETIEEALTNSLVWMGYPNAAYMAKLLGRPIDQVEADAMASELVFKDPVSGNLTIRDSYLSGYVQGKLDAARAAAEEDPAFRRNVAALEAALPERKSISAIGVAMNSPWMPPGVLTAYMESIGISDARVEYNPAANYWSVFGYGNSERFSTQGADTVELIQNALEMTDPRVMTYEGTGRDRKQVYDAPASMLAKTKMNQMKEDFAKWVKTADVEIDGRNMQDVVTEAFNEKANGHVPPKFEGKHITLPGASEEVYRNGIRRGAIARMLDSGGGLIAHGVGFGKTYTLIGLAMELKRLGKANRPLITVENATLQQFAASFRVAYPQANILVADSKSFAGPNRRRFIARIATGDYDAIIMAHSQFNLIANNPDVVNSYINDQIAELEAARALTDSSDKRAVAALEKAKIGLENSRKEILDSLHKRQDMGLFWEDLGVDALLVDEAHRFKNAPIITRMHGLKNLPTGKASQRAIGMVLKTQSVQARMGGRGVYFATGTPISNSIAEAYIMMRFTSPELLREQGIENFDQFAAMYATTSTGVEANWKGKISSETRFSRYINGEALMNLIGSSWDIKIDPDLAGIKRPTVKGGGGGETILVEPGPANQAFNDWVTNTVAAQWDDPAYWQSLGGRKQAIEDNPWLSAVPIMTMQAGVAAALDIRMVDPNAPDFEGSKVNTAVKQILSLYKESGDRLGTQAVFTDLQGDFSMDHLLAFAGDPGLSDAGLAPPELDAEGNAVDEGKRKVKKKRQFDIFNDLRDKLVAGGIPRSEIGMIRAGMSKDARAELFDKVNAGQVRVVIGSSDTMGVGVNIQERLYALHHLMPPRDFKPSAMEQRDGRILRQGNQHYDLEVEAFVKSAEESTGRKFQKEKSGRMVPDIDAAKAALEGNAEALDRANKAAEKFHIRILKYGMEKSIDSAMYSMMVAKQLGFNQVLLGKSGNSFEDPSDAITMNMAEMAARTIGDPLLIRLVELERDIRAINMEYSGWQDDVSSARENLRRARQALSFNRTQQGRIAGFVDAMAEIGKDPERETVWEFGGKTIDRNRPKDAEKGWKAPKFIESLDLFLAEESSKLAHSERKMSKMEIKVDGVPFTLEIHQNIRGDATAVGDVYWGGFDSRADARLVGSWSGAASLNSVISGMRRQAAALPGQIAEEMDRLEKKIPALERAAAQTFDREAEFNALITEQQRVQEQLNAAATGTRTAGRRVEAEFRAETPANYPGKGLAPAMATLGSSADSKGFRTATTLAEARSQAADFVGNPITNKDDGMTATVSKNAVGKMLSESAVRKSISEATHAHAVANLDKLFEEAIRTHSGPDERGDTNIAAMHRYYAPFKFSGRVLLAKLTVKEFARPSEGSRIYSVESMDIVKPAGNWVASISEDRRNYTPQAGFEDKLQAKIDGIKRNHSSLGSSPESSGVQEALAKMPPKFRKVFEDIEAGDSPAAVMKRHDISEKGLTMILNQVRARIATATAAAGDTLKPAMRDGLIDGGRPDLALSTNPTIAAVDQLRNESDIPDVRHWEEVNAKAAEMLAKDYQGTYDMLLGKARDLQPLTDLEVAASKMIISKETLSGRIVSPADRVKLGMMIFGYRDQGTETARSLAIRRDPHLSPAERHAQFIAEALFTPDVETRKRMKNNPKAAETILAGWMKQVDAIEAELLAQGIDIRKALATFTAGETARKQAEAESPRAKAVIDEQIRKLTRREKAVIEAIRSGALVSKAAFLSGLSTDEVKAIYSRFLADIKTAMAESAKRFLAGSLASSPGDMMGEILAGLGLPEIDAIDDTRPDFVDRRSEKPKTPRKSRKPKAPEAPEAPEVPGITPEQQAELDAAFERFKNSDPSTWTALWQQEEKKLAPMIGQKAFEKFKGKALQPWRDAWQTEMDAVMDPAKRMSFEDWIAKPREEWTAEQADLFQLERERGEVSTTTGTFDIHDPVAVKRVMDAFAIARGSKMDALMEFWRMSILTGPQTHIVNTTSNVMNLAYHLIPQRGIEATWNAVLGVVGQRAEKGATFGEFAPIARNLNKAMQIATRNMLRAWSLNERVFEHYAASEAIQLDFSGAKAENIAPALGGKIGTVMRSLSFRAMSAADEFMKSFYGQLEAAAQAHRIAAVEEKLTGDAYAKRIDELMIPGSRAWIRAIDGAKLVTFQDELNGDNPQLIRRLDQLAMLAKKGRAMPWIGRPLTLFLPFIDTPLNIFKQAVEMSPLGTAISVIDATRALKRKVFAGKLTKAEADAEAALIYDRARLVRDLANQTVGWAVLFALQGLVQGGDDDEPDKLPVITGTTPYKTTRRGERDNTYAVMPPMTIRIGDVQFSYSRFEPFATVMAGAADLLLEMHRTGGMKPEVMSKWLMSFKDQAKDKTFLQGVSNLLNAIEDPDRFAERLTANTLSGFVPNIIRQPVREADPTIRDQNPRPDDGFFTAVAKRIGFSVAPQLAPAKMDVWGNPVPSNRGALVGGTRATDMAFRILDPTNAQVNPKIEPIDRWIYRFNRGTADSKDRIAIEPISNSVSITVPGEKRPRSFALTQAEQDEANRNAGRTALEVLGKDWDKTPLTSENAQRIIDTVQSAQRIERDRLKMQKLAEATK